METPEWMQSLPEEMQSNESLAKFSDVEALAGSYVNAEKMIGKDTIVKPTTEDEWESAYNQLGRPEEANNYELKTPEDLPEGIDFDDEMMTSFKEQAHKAGLNQSQIEALNSWYWDHTTKAYNTLSDGVEDTQSKSVENLKKDWGERYDVNLTMAKRAVEQFGDENFTEYLEQTGLGDNPQMVRFMHAVAKANLEEGDIEGQGNDNSRTMEPSQIREQINDIMSQAAYTNKQDPNHGILVTKVQKLFGRLHAA